MPAIARLNPNHGSDTAYADAMSKTDASRTNGEPGRTELAAQVSDQPGGKRLSVTGAGHERQSTIGVRSMSRTMNKAMKTVAIDRFGGLNEMKIRELPVPELDANEILVRVEAAGVGVWDPFEREGGFAKEFNMSPKFPIILGSDGAGTVEAIGEKVSHFKKGDRVYGISFMSPKGGFYAEHVVMKETHAAHIPGKLSATQARAMAVDVVTAFAGLDTTLHLKAGG